MKTRICRDSLEQVLILLVVVIVGVVMLVHTIGAGNPLQEDAVPVASLEQYRPSLTTGLLQEHVVTFRLKNYSSLPLAKVLVNGEPRGEFRDHYVTVFVQEGDMLEVDGSHYNRPLDIEILDVSKEVVVPAAGEHLRVEGGIVCLGRVRLGNR